MKNNINTGMFSKLFYCIKRTLFGQKKNLYYLSNFTDHWTQGRVIVFDTKTTGLSRHHDDIVQIAAVEAVKGVRGKTIMFYFSTSRKLDPNFFTFSHKTLESKAVDKKEGLKVFLDFIGDDPLLAHNVMFDVEILNNNLKSAGLNLVYKNKLFCSLYMSRQLYPKLFSYKLGKVLDALSLEKGENQDALEDAKATAALASALKEKYVEGLDFS